MVKFKKRALYIMLLIIITMSFSAVIVLTNVSSVNNELSVIKTETGIMVENIQQYIANNNRATTNMASSAVDDISFKYLKILQFDDEEIQNMTSTRLAEYESAAYVYVSSQTYNVVEYLVDEGSKTHSSKITITTRLLRVPSLDTNVRAYRMEAVAKWDKSPSYRLKDIFAFNATAGSVYGKASSGARAANISYVESYTAYGTSKSFSYDAPHSKIEEYNVGEPLFAYRANLPNDVVGIGASNLCSSIKITMSCTIYNNSAFNVYTSYGHKYVGGQAELSLKDANIKFNTSCDKYDGPMLSETSNKV